MSVSNKICAVGGCSREVRAKEHCQLHYDRLLYTGEVGDVLPMQKKPRGVKCSVDDCHKKSRGDGLCITHYARRQRHGEVGTAELQRRAMGTGSITEAGYKKIVANGKSVFEHRHIMEQMLGRPLRKGENVHHKNGQRLCNEPENLELWLTLQPSGQRVEDLVAYAIKLITQYPEVAFKMGHISVKRDSNNKVLTLSDAISGLMSNVA